MTGASFENVRRMLNELSTAADPGLVVLIAEVRRGPDRPDGSIVREFLAREPDFRSIFTAWLMLNDAHRYADVCCMLAVHLRQYLMGSIEHRRAKPWMRLLL